MKGDNKTLGTLALVVGVAGISASATLNKLVMADGLHPVWVSVLRLGLTVALMLPFFLGKRDARQAFGLLSRREKGLTLLAGVMLAIHFTTWAAALKYADSVIAVSIWSTFTLMTVVGSSLILHERTPLPALLGIFVALVGVGVCAIGASGVERLGVVMALIAAFTQAVYTLCGRAVRKKMATLPYTMAVYSTAFACLLAYALLTRLSTQGITWRATGVSLALALVCTLGGHTMQNFALRYYKAQTVSAATLMEVFTGPLLVYFFLGEVPNIASVIGGVIILAGVGWYMFSEWRIEKRHAAPVQMAKNQ